MSVRVFTIEEAIEVSKLQKDHNDAQKRASEILKAMLVARRVLSNTPSNTPERRVWHDVERKAIEVALGALEQAPDSDRVCKIH